MKKISLIIVLLIILNISTGCGCKKNKKENNNKNKENKIELKDTTIKTEKDDSEIYTKIVNSTNSNKYIKKISLRFYDKDGAAILESVSDVNRELKPNEIYELKYNTGINIANADVSKTQFKLIEE